jgi:hypothetical protein
MSPAQRTIILAAGAVGLTGAALASRGAPSQPAPAPAETLLGPEVSVGKGTARTFVLLGPHGEPRTVGVALGEAALTGLSLA